MEDKDFSNKLSNSEKDSEEIQEIESGKETTEKSEKQPKRTLFNDLRRFKNTNVTIIVFGGELVKGKLLGYDEVANCVIEDEKKNQMVVFGKSITMVCEGDLHPL